MKRERGSAYVLALLILVVLTLVGLSLSLTTSTEMQIGANERQMERVFYTADAAIGIGTARILVTSDFSEQTYNLGDPGGSSLVENEARVGPVIPLLEAPCALCEINNIGTYNEKAFKRANIAVPAAGTRAGLAETTAVRRLIASIDVQPWKIPLAAYLALESYSPSDLAEKVEF